MLVFTLRAKRSCRLPDSKQCPGVRRVAVRRYVREQVGLCFLSVAGAF